MSFFEVIKLTDENGNVIGPAEEATLATLLTETQFDTVLGEVQATPTANTVLARLKTIADNQLPNSHDVTVDNQITGFATSAKQDTIIGHIDGIEALLTTIDTDTSNLDVALSTRASAANQVHKFASGISGATKVNASLQGQTADATLYTVVGTLFQGIITLTARNTSTATNGVFHIRDGNGGTILFSVTIGLAVVGQTAPITAKSYGTDAFPIEAGTALYLDVVSGSPVVDIHAVGIDG